MIGSRPKVVVVGSSNTDLVVSVPRIPSPGETILGGALQTTPGGKGANQAVAAARLGGDVTFIARVGDDSFGASSLAGFVREGIDTRFVFIAPGVASGVALIAVSETSGENSIVVAPGANALLSADDVEAASEAFDTADVVILSLEVPMRAVQRAAEMAAERNIPVILNPAPARPLAGSLLTYVSILTPNEREARQLAAGIGGSDVDATTPLPEIAHRLLGGGPTAVVVTLGASGVLIATCEGSELCPALAVKVVDTVAAGDCFTGGLAVEIARGAQLRDAVRFASAAAALKVTRAGAQAGLPTRAEVERFLDKSR